MGQRSFVIYDLGHLDSVKKVYKRLVKEDKTGERRARFGDRRCDF